MVSFLGWVALAACASKDTIVKETGEAEPALEDQFSFVVMADPHIAGVGDHVDRLHATVGWINTNAVADDLAFVLIVGDIAWGDGLEKITPILEELDIPYVPIIGDNVIQVGDEEKFETVFSAQYQRLSGQLDNWRQAPVMMDNPDILAPSWLQNIAFQYNGVHFFGLDWCTRHVGGVFGEMADLHDFDSGTLPWLQAELSGLPAGVSDDVIFVSHHPMHLSPGAFDAAEMETLLGTINPSLERVYANIAGHYHINYEASVEGGYDLFVTDAIHDDENMLRIVSVRQDASGTAYVHTLVTIE